jgi:hypothetical protein
MASSLIDGDAPMDLLVDGELTESVRSSFDEEEFLEEVYLEGGLKWDEILQRKLDYWVELIVAGEIPLQHQPDWNELARYVVPVCRLVKFITGVGIMPAESRARFARKIFWIDFNRPIKREPLHRLISYGTRIEGYAIVLAELVVAFDQYQQAARDGEGRDPETQWESVEDWWDRVSGWDADDRLDDLLPRIRTLCPHVLSGIELEYAPNGIEKLREKHSS